MVKKGLLVMIIILFSAISVFCGEFEDTLKKAERGDADAQHNLGYMYATNQGVAQDYKQAVYWFTKAAEQGVADSQFNLGLMYANGEGITQDYKQSVYWYTKAAEQGVATAQFNLGLMYAKGQGVNQDYTQSVYWYTKAAEQGHAKAQFNLGLSYEKGQGVAQDYKQAAHWYTKAAEQGNADAQSNLGLMYANGQGVAQDYKRAVNWFTKAAEQGDAVAQYNLAVMYYDGQGITQNFKLAYVWESLAAAQGIESAIKNRDITAKKLSPQQLAEAQDLAAQIQYKIDNPVKLSSVANPTLTPNHRTPTSTSTEKVRWIQQTLKSLGYNPGSFDGVTGARTRDAIIAFQTDLGVAPTGIIDEVLVAQLRLMSKINQESPTADTEKKVGGTGTGFIITRDGYVLTCYHVIKGAAKIEIALEGKTYPATLVRDDPNNDLAMLKINGSFPAIAFSSDRSAKMGQAVFTIGYPNPGLQGVSAKFTEGTINSLTGFQDDIRLYQISIPVQPGNSGGALLDENGNILGVVVAMLDAKTTFKITGSLPQNVNYAVKSSYAQALLDTLPEVVGKLSSPAKTKSDAIANAEKGTVMVICYN